MSLILDALKRAERERRGDTGPAPEVVSMPIAGTGTPRRRPRWLGHAVVAGGLALGGVLIWDAFRVPPAPAPEPAAATPAPQAEPIKARPAPPAQPTVVPGTEDVASLDDLTDEPELEVAPPAEKPVPAKPAPAKPAPAKPAAKKPAPAKPAPLTDAESPRTAAVETVPAPPPQAGAVSPSEPEPAPAPTPAPATATPEAVPPALTQPAPLRKFREMPPDYRADFPALRVEIHVYEKAPARRFVMINGKRYREGERMAEGPTLVEIVPDGMVFDYRGEKVLYTLSR